MTTSTAKIRDFKRNLPKALLFLVDNQGLPDGAVEVYLLVSNGLEILCFDEIGKLHRVSLKRIKKISPQRSEHVLTRYNAETTKIIWKKTEPGAEEMAFGPLVYTGSPTLDLDVIIKRLNIRPIKGIAATKTGRKAQDYTYDNLNILGDSLIK